MALAHDTDHRPVDAVARNLHIRLAETEAEIAAAQALRYRIFYEEMAAESTQEMARLRRDFDTFDAFCDHLIVLDTDRGHGPDAVVGTYRLMRREAAARRGQFYSIDEYDIGPILSYPGEILECGRSCVDRAYRTGATMSLLWRGIAEYVFHYEIDLLFGCASIPGVDPDRLALPLSYLYHYHLAPPGLRARAVKRRYVDMNRLPAERIDAAAARQALPPLIKGYLRLGGFVGDGAVIDPQFGTTDVCVVVKTDLVTERYYKHYRRDDTGRSGAE